MSSKKPPPIPIAPHVPHPYSYPECCGEVTRLSVFGWHCAKCGVYHEFRDDNGLSFQQAKVKMELDEALGD